MADLNWADIRILLALFRHPRTAEAAASLGVNVTTVLRRLSSLERVLGCPLFLSLPSGWQPTAAALRMLPLATAMETNATSLERAAASELTELRGTLRLSAPEALATEFLIPLLAELRSRFPEVALEVVATNRLTNLTRREADLALRLNPPVDEALLARKLATVRSVLVASSGYLAARGVPSPDRITDHDFVWDSRAMAGSLEGVWLSTHAAKARVVLRTDNTWARCAAATAGLGITFLPCYALASRPELRPIDGLPPLTPRPLWLLLHRDSKRQLLIRRMAQALARVIVERRAVLEAAESTRWVVGSAQT